MTTIQIKHPNTGEVLYECDTPEGMESGLLMRYALEKAAAAKASLGYANLGEGKKLVGDRPVLTIGPIGSRCDYMTAYLTESGVYVRAGCFFDKLEQFEITAAETHSDNEHGREYIAAVALVKAHAEIWTPKEEVQHE